MIQPELPVAIDRLRSEENMRLVRIQLAGGEPQSMGRVRVATPRLDAQQGIEPGARGLAARVDEHSPVPTLARGAFGVRETELRCLLRSEERRVGEECRARG